VVFIIPFFEKRCPAATYEYWHKTPTVNNYPNFGSILQVIKDGNIDWAASSQVG